MLARGESLPEFDLHCPLMSLPRLFGTTLETIPAEVPYLRASEERIAQWRQRLGAPRGRRIGIVGSGRPVHVHGYQRSISVAELEPLFARKGLEFVSLYKEIRPDDQALLEARSDVRHFADEIRDFDDTAALLSLVDQVISVDTAVAHLAGALARPVWILLPFIASWRWMRDREDSPWYPTARLFCQTRPGDWSEVVDLRDPVERGHRRFRRPSRDPSTHDRVDLVRAGRPERTNRVPRRNRQDLPSQLPGFERDASAEPFLVVRRFQLPSGAHGGHSR